LGKLGKCPGPRAFGGLAFEYQNTALLVFHVFTLFTTRQNCSFLITALVYTRLKKLTTLAFIVWSDLKELNQTAPRSMIQELDRNQCIQGVCRNFFQRGQRRNFAYPFQVADDAIQMDVHKTLYLFHPISLCWLS